MKKIIAVVILIIFVVIGVIATAMLMFVIGDTYIEIDSKRFFNNLGYQYNYENELYHPKEIKHYEIITNATVNGYVKGKLLSVYILDEENFKRFKNKQDFNAIYKWENVSYIKLNFTTSNNVYLVVKNELNEYQWITVKFIAKRGQS